MPIYAHMSALALIVMMISIFGARPAQAAEEQAVIVHFEHTGDWADFFEWEPKIEKAVKGSHAGDYDGNELAVNGSDGKIYMYGPSADQLLMVARPYLQAATFLKNKMATLRYGDAKDPHAREVNIPIKP